MSQFAEFSDDQLIALVKASKDHMAFTELVKRHQSALLAFLARLTDDAYHAQDLTQDTFIKCYDHIQSFNHQSLFSTWLFSIGYREFLQSRRKSQSLRKMIQRFKQSLTRKEPATIQDHSDLNAALSRLSHQQKGALILCDVYGMSHTEAASTLGLPLGSVKTYIKQARSLMKDYLE